MKRIALPLLVVAMACATGCVSYRGPEPLYPRLSWSDNPLVPQRVASLRPTFRWQPTRPGATYQLAVYEGSTKARYSLLTGFGHEALKGERVYGKSGLTSCEHTLEVDLKPQTVYIWSVRETGGVWMSASNSFRKYRNWPVFFETP